MSLQEITYCYVVCDDCDREGDDLATPSELNTQIIAEGLGWETVEHRRRHRCPDCVKERREQEAIAPMLAREAVLGPWHENGNIDPAYGTALTLDVAV